MKKIVLLICLLPTIVSADPLYRLQTGSWWKYQVNGGEEPSVTNIISDSTLIDGVMWYSAEEYGDKFWIRNSERGQVEATNFFDSIPDTNSKAAEIVAFKFPASKGETWTNEAGKSTYLGIIGMTVPAGRYKCHMYRLELSETEYSDHCIAEEVGIIFNEFVLDGQKKRISELTSYELK